MQNYGVPSAGNSLDAVDLFNNQIVESARACRSKSARNTDRRLLDHALTTLGLVCVVMLEVVLAFDAASYGLSRG
jgi:hypothetical protein